MIIVDKRWPVPIVRASVQVHADYPGYHASFLVDGSHQNTIISSGRARSSYLLCGSFDWTLDDLELANKELMHSGRSAGCGSDRSRLIACVAAFFVHSHAVICRMAQTQRGTEKRSRNCVDPSQ